MVSIVIFISLFAYEIILWYEYIGLELLTGILNSYQIPSFIFLPTYPYFLIIPIKSLEV
jgi:hypothetical protein